MHRILSPLIAALTLQVLAPHTAQAQAAPAADSGIATAVRQQATLGDITRPDAGAVSAFQLKAATQSNQASVNIAGKLNFGSFLDDFGWSILASSPLSMGGDSSGGSSATNTKLATLDGLANGFSAKFRLSWFHMMSLAGFDPSVDPIYQNALKTCLGTPGMTTASCGIAEGILVRTYDKAEYDTFLDRHFPPANGLRALTGGLEAGVGYNNFTFYNATTLAKSSQAATPWSAGAYFGVMPYTPQTMPTLVTFAAKYQNVFTAQQTSTMCVNANSAIACQTGAFRPPKHSEKYLLSVDLHNQFQLGEHHFAVAPQFTYDAKGHTVGVDLPLYFILDSKGNLIAGIDAGWTSDNHAFSVGFMIGVPFGFFQ